MTNDGTKKRNPESDPGTAAALERLWALLHEAHGGMSVREADAIEEALDVLLDAAKDHYRELFRYG